MMQHYNRDSIEKLLEAWACWVRAGRTWPNRLGYPNSSPGYGDGVEPPTDMDGVARRKRRRDDPNRIATQPHQVSTRVSRSRTVVPLSFLRDRDVERVDVVIRCLPPFHRCVVIRRILQRQQVAEIATLLLCSTKTVARNYADAITAIEAKMNTESSRGSNGC